MDFIILLFKDTKKYNINWTRNAVRNYADDSKLNVEQQKV